MLLTGVLCVVAPRSPLQLIVAMCVCLCYTVLVLHLLPYVTNTSDRLSVICAMSLTLTLAIGLLQMAEFPSEGGASKKLIEGDEIDSILMCASTVPIVVFAHNLVLHACGGKFRRSRSIVLTEVLPLQQDKGKLDDTRNWGSSAPKQEQEHD